MERKYWAKHKKTIIGPFDTQEQAVLAMYDRMADKRPLPDYLAKSPRNQIMTGYGSTGPYFDLRWHDAYSESMAKRDLGM